MLQRNRKCRIEKGCRWDILSRLHPFLGFLDLDSDIFEYFDLCGRRKNEAELAKILCCGTGFFCTVGEKAKNKRKNLLKIHALSGRFYVEIRMFLIYNIRCYQVKIDKERF